jgi:exonuclease III
MANICIVASININGIANNTLIRMLEEFLWTHDIELALLQEVTGLQMNSIRRYTKHINLGVEKRGIGILAKEGINPTDIRRLPSGRGMATNFHGTCLINLYAPLGAEKKQERESFYNT